MINGGGLIYHPLIRLDKLEELVCNHHYYIYDPQDQHQLTPAEITITVIDLQIKGYKYLPLCKNTNQDGACLGHKGIIK